MPSLAPQCRSTMARDPRCANRMAATLAGLLARVQEAEYQGKGDSPEVIGGHASTAQRTHGIFPVFFPAIFTVFSQEI